MSTTFGCDCEFILTLHGQYKSAVPVLKGTREKREKLNGHEIFHDNVLAEVAVQYGASRHQVVENFGAALKWLASKVAPCRLNLAASADFPEKELLDPDAKQAGCDEETDAYTRMTLPSQEEAVKSSPFRTAGGHIHLGGAGVLQNSIKVKLVIYALDLFVGIPSLFLDNNILAVERRQMYGKAGSYREKPYGLEYRVLGPFWLRSPDTVKLIYDLSMFALDFVDSGKIDRFWEVNEEKLFAGRKDAYRCYGYDKDALIRAINEQDMETAAKFMLIVNQYLPAELGEELSRQISLTPDFYESWGL